MVRVFVGDKALGSQDNDHYLVGVYNNSLFNYSRSTKEQAENAEGFGWMDPQRTRQAIRSIGFLDIREFASNVGTGIEENDTDAIEMAWQEAVTATIANDGSARNGSVTRILLPEGQLLYGSTGLTSAITDFRGSFGFVGTGANGTRIKITDVNTYFIDIDDGVLSCYFADFQVVGGKGFYRKGSNGFGGGLTGGKKVFERIAFSDYSSCAIASNHEDDPLYVIRDCKFTGLAGSKAAVIPPGSGHQITGNWLNMYSYGFHIRGGKGVLLQSNRFGGISYVDRRIDIWLELVDSSSGQGLLSLNNNHGNENDNANDYEWLVADSNSSGNVNHSTMPDYGSYQNSTDIIANTKTMTGVTIKDRYSIGANRTSGLMLSYTTRIGQCIFDVPNIHSHLVEFAPSITTLGISNRFPQTNVIRLYDGQSSGQQPSIKTANLPGFGMTFDVSDSAVGYLGSLSNNSATDVVTSLMTAKMDSLANQGTTSSVSALEADVTGGMQAKTVTFNQVDGRAWIGLDLTNAEVNQLCWLDFDISEASSQKITAIDVRIGSSFSDYFRSWRVNVPSTWQRFSLPFLLPQIDTALRVNFMATSTSYVAGTGNKVRIGRVRSYQANCTVSPVDLRPKSTWVDNGNLNKTLSAISDSEVQYWNTPLTANIVITLPDKEVSNGDKFRIIRGPDATGAYYMSVIGKQLSTVNTWAEVEFINGSWRLIAYGSM